MQKQMSLEPIFESRQCWCCANVGRQTVPCRRTGDAEYCVPKTSSGTWSSSDDALYKYTFTLLYFISLTCT